MVSRLPGVLQEEEDVLVNVNIVDKEKAKKNVELRKKKPEYRPYEEEESVDDMAIVRRVQGAGPGYVGSHASSCSLKWALIPQGGSHVSGIIGLMVAMKYDHR